VQQHVDDVVAERLQPPQEVVEAKREHRQRSVGFVRAAVPQRRAPEVVKQQAGDWRGGSDVIVGQDCPAETHTEVDFEMGEIVGEIFLQCS
jgi:hypothetical protein